MKLFAHLTPPPEIKLPAFYPTLSPASRRTVRELYMRNQQGLCYHCGEELSGPPADGVFALDVEETLFPPNFFDHPVHLHHDHETGLTIGAVHAYCNAVLWQFHGE